MPQLFTCDVCLTWGFIVWTMQSQTKVSIHDDFPIRTNLKKCFELALNYFYYTIHYTNSGNIPEDTQILLRIHLPQRKCYNIFPAHTTHVCLSIQLQHQPGQPPSSKSANIFLVFNPSGECYNLRGALSSNCGITLDESVAERK